MNILYILVSASIAVGVFNLIAVLFLSNSLFRMFLSNPPKGRLYKKTDSDDKGLVDMAQTLTYDPRFAAKNASQVAK